MNKQKIFLVIAAALGIVSVFLPWKNVQTFLLPTQVNGLQYLSGIVVLILFGGILAMSLMGDQKMALSNLYKLGIAIAGILVAVLGIKLFFNLRLEMKQVKNIANIANAPTSFEGLTGEMLKFGSISIGIGLYLSVIVGIGISLISFLIKNPTVKTAPES